MTVTYKCGHVASLPREVSDTPSCGICGERVVSRVDGARPRFRGACSGPVAETCAVEPDRLPLVAHRLVLKEPE